MPNPWKKPRPGGGGVSRILAALRPDPGGSLVVQTGFPTSLADLVVKNRGRLKKPSRKKKPPSELGSPAPDPVAPAAARASPLDGGPRPGAASVGRPIPAAEDGSESSLGCTETKKRGLAIVFVLLLVMTLVLVVLAIERKKLVAGITLSAFALLLLDSMGFQALEFLKPCSDAKMRLNIVVGEWDFEGRGVVSPIRERSSLESIDLDQGREVLERRDLVGVGKVLLAHDLGSKGNSKAKKLFRKLVPRKFRAQTDGKNGKELISDFSWRGVSDGITEIEEVVEEEEATNGLDDAVLSSGDVVSINASDRVTDHYREDIEFTQENEYETKSRNSLLLVFCAVVLMGLLGGKSVALVLTFSWFLLCKAIKSLWKEGKVLVV